MDRSIDSIGSCSLDVDADSTDFSDTSESLNFLTPSSQKEFTAGIAERVKRIQPLTPKLILQQPTSFQNSYPIATTTATTTYFDINSGKINTILSQTTANGSSYFNGPLDIKSPTTNTSTVSASKKPSYLNLACCVNGYSNYTTYDSQERKEINKSREVSPIRPIIMSRQQRSNDNLLAVPNSTTTTTFVSKSPLSSVTKKFSSLTIQDRSGDTTDNAGIKTNGSLNGSSSADKILIKKSFIQQRVEKLYGSQEQALASPKIVNYIQRRSTDTLIDTSCLSNGSSTINGGSNGSSVADEKENDEQNLNSLPVMRLLRPEFCKQLQFSSPKKSLTSSKSNNFVNSINTTTSTTSIMTLKTSTSTNGQIYDSKKSFNNNGDVTNVEHFNLLKATNDKKESNTNHNEVIVLNSSNKLNNSLSHTMKNGNNIVDEKLEENSDSENFDSHKNCNNSKFGVLNLEESNNKLNSMVVTSDQQQEQKQLPQEEPATNGNGEKKNVVKDGNYFLEVLNTERSRILKLAQQIEDEMTKLQAIDPDCFSEDVIGLILSAIGKSRLLATKKMKQFEGLCNDNLHPPADQPWTTNDDLQGFWDMLLLQVDNVDAAFSELQKCKENGWKKPKPQSPQMPKGSKLTKRPLSQAQAAKAKQNPTKKPAAAPSNTLAQQKREEARKKLMELKRKQKAAIASSESSEIKDIEMKEPVAEGKENDVEIFF